MRKRRLLLIALLTSVACSGCWDRREINDIAFVVASAFDKEEDQYRASVQIPLPGQLGGVGSSGGGGGTSGEKPWYVDSASGRTIREANSKQQKTLPRALYFAHRRVLLIGEDLAKEGVGPILDISARIPQNRLTSFVMITEGLGRDMLNIDAPTESFPAEMMREMAQSSMRNPRTLKHFTELLLTDGVDPAVPFLEMVKTDPGPRGKVHTIAKVAGLAVFGRGEKMVGVLQEPESTGALLAMGQARNAQITVPAPEGDGFLSVTLQENTTRLTPTLEGDRIKMRIDIRTKAALTDNQSTYDLTYQNNVARFERAIAAQIEANILAAMRVLQKDLHSDPMGFGRKIHQSNPDEWKKLNDHWEDKLEQVEVEVHPLVHVEHVGAVTLPIGRKDGVLDR